MTTSTKPRGLGPQLRRHARCQPRFEPLEARLCLSTLDFAAAPVPPRPRVTAVTYLDQPAAGQIRVAVDFSVSMAVGPASNLRNYSVGSDAAAGLPVLSATYADGGDHHRAVLTVRTDGPVGGTYQVRVNGPALVDTAGVALGDAGAAQVGIQSNYSNTIEVVGARPDGTIGLLGTPLTLGYGLPSTVEAADFDRDGKPDLLILLDRGTNSVGTSLARVAIQTNLGGGQFTAPVVLDDSPGIPPIAARAVDWNGDGSIDVVVGELTGRDAAQLQVYLNDGHGHFTADPDSPIPLPNNTVSSGAAFAKGLAVMWDGSFGEAGAPSHLRVVAKDPFLGYSVAESLELRRYQYPATIVLGDFNEDGKPDIVSGNGSFGGPGGDVLFFASSGTTHGAGVAIDFDHHNKPPGNVRAGDFNGDGHLDLIVLTDLTEFSYPGDPLETSLTVLIGDGHGHFSAQDERILERAHLALMCDPVDMDGDNKLDLIVTTASSIWVLKNDGKGGFIPTTDDPVVSADPSVITSASVADIDRDGKPDVVLGGDTLSTARIMTNQGHGRLAVSAVPGPTLGTNVRLAGNGGSSIAQADVNLDGLPDWIKTEPSGVSVYLGLPDGAYAAPIQSVSTQPDCARIRVGDLNNDGRPDIILEPGRGTATVGVLLGRGDGRFDQPQGPLPVAVGGETTGLFEGELADVNGDGNLDLVISLSHSEGYYVVPYAYAVMFGDGKGNLTYNANTVVRALFPSGGWSYGPVNLGDFDNDGKVDILGRTASGLTVFHGDGRGKFAPTVTAADAGGGERFLQGDLDGDGKTDLVAYTGSYASNRLLDIYKGDGIGHFTPMPGGANIDSGGRMALVALADVNADGKLDIAYTYDDTFETHKEIVVLAGDGTGKFGAKQLIAVPESPWSITPMPLQPFLNAGTITIGSLQFGVAAPTAFEADGTISIPVVRIGDAAGSASVNYHIVPGTAVAGQDYTDVSGKLTFAPGEIVKRITVPIENDSIHEADETFQVVLDDVSGAFLGAPSQVMVTISDNDEPENCELSFESASYSGFEDRNVRITVVRTGSSAGTVSVGYTTVDGTARTDSDDADYNYTSGTLVFGPGVLSNSFNVSLYADTLLEPDETFSVILTGPLRGATPGTPATTTVAIVDDHHPAGKPLAPALSEQSDTGQSSSDRITRNGGWPGAPLDFKVSESPAQNDFFRLFDVTDPNNPVLIAGPTQATDGIVSVSDHVLIDGTHKIAATSAVSRLSAQTAMSASTTITVRTSLNVLSFTPALRAYSGLAGAPIVVTFNGPLAGFKADDATGGGFASMPTAVTLTPRGPDGSFAPPTGINAGSEPIPATLIYHLLPTGGSTITLIPRQPLSTDVYRIVVSSGLVDLAGNSLRGYDGRPGSYSATFQLRPVTTFDSLKVVSVTTRHASVNIANNSVLAQPDTIAIGFNRGVDFLTVSSSIVQLLAGPKKTPVPAALAYSPTNHVIYVTPTALLVPGTIYTIRVAGTGKASSSVTDDRSFPNPGLALAKTFSTAFQVKSKGGSSGQGPFVALASNGHLQTNPGFGPLRTVAFGYASIPFSKPVNLSTLSRASVNLTLAAGGLKNSAFDAADVPLSAQIAFNPNLNMLIVVPTQPIGNGTYRYTLGASLTSLNGEPLKNPGGALPVTDTFIVKIGVKPALAGAAGAVRALLTSRATGAASLPPNARISVTRRHG